MRGLCGILTPQTPFRKHIGKDSHASKFFFHRTKYLVERISYEVIRMSYPESTGNGIYITTILNEDKEYLAKIT